MKVLGLINLSLYMIKKIVGVIGKINRAIDVRMAVSGLILLTRQLMREFMVFGGMVRIMTYVKRI